MAPLGFLKIFLYSVYCPELRATWVSWRFMEVEWVSLNQNKWSSLVERSWRAIFCFRKLSNLHPAGSVCGFWPEAKQPPVLKQCGLSFFLWNPLHQSLNCLVFKFAPSCALQGMLISCTLTFFTVHFSNNWVHLQITPLWKVKGSAWPLSSGKQTLNREGYLPRMVKVEASFLAFPWRRLLSSIPHFPFPSCFDWAVSPPFFHIHVGVAALAAWLPLSVGRRK